MSNMREEILRLTVDRLQNKVESTMLIVNIILSNPEKVSIDKMTDLMIELSMAESALNNAKTLYSQCVGISERMKKIQESAEENSIEHRQSEK